MSSFTERMIGAAKLDPAIYEEVEADRGALGQAVGVVVLASLALGVAETAYAGFWAGVIGVTIGALVSWFAWAFVTWFVGTRLLPESETKSDMGEMLRTIGFSSAPGVFRIFGFIPGIGTVIIWVCNLWMLAAMVVGVRQALDYKETWRAVAVCAIGWVALLIIQLIVLALVGPATVAGGGA